ncbi:hypothetical protein ACOBV9_18265 (plasmid) [Pseudoalteromonas espejiana]
MCYIYRARDLFLESPSRPEVFVAIKVLLEEFSQSESNNTTQKMKPQKLNNSLTLIL